MRKLAFSILVLLILANSMPDYTDLSLWFYTGESIEYVDQSIDNVSDISNVEITESPDCIIYTFDAKIAQNWTSVKLQSCNDATNDFILLDNGSLDY